jgi:salicylate biosynthesis isochorismate synthase/menaquinone-specific isochorismate synthase
VGVGLIESGGTLAADVLSRVERAVKRARKSGRPVLLGITTRLGADVDPSAVVFASRAAGENWFCFEQPDRDGSALAALGTVTRLTATGARRFERVAAAWRELSASAVADAPDGPPGAGLVALGGFAFAPDGGRSPQWSGFEAADLVVPEVALARRGDDVRLTLAALAAPDDVPEELAARLQARAAALKLEPLPLLETTRSRDFR